MRTNSNIIVNHTEIWNLPVSGSSGSSITEIVLFSYKPVGLMVFIRSSSKNVSYSSIVQFSDSTPFSVSGFFGYQQKRAINIWCTL